MQPGRTRLQDCLRKPLNVHVPPQVQVFIRVSLSGVLVCCRPCTHYIARRRIQREYEDKLRTKAFEKAQQLEAARKREEEEKRLAAEIELERTRHLKVSGKDLPIVPVPAGMLPTEVSDGVCRWLGFSS